MKIEPRKLHNGTMATVYPFDGDTFTNITATAQPASEVLADPARYQVNWPSIGAQNTTKTREFAMALLAACDWVDEQEKNNG
jgi:hypothetical protein